MERVIFNTIPLSCQKSVRDSLPRKVYEFFYNGVNDFHPICPVCGNRIYGDFNIGHIISVFHKGSNRYENLVALHPGCNVGTDNLVTTIDNLSPETRSQILMIEYNRQ